MRFIPGKRLIPRKIEKALPILMESEFNEKTVQLARKVYNFALKFLDTYADDYPSYEYKALEAALEFCIVLFMYKLPIEHIFVDRLGN